MSYWVLFLIIALANMVVGVIFAAIINKYGGEGLIILFPTTLLTAIFFFIGVPLGFLLGNVKEYSHNEYDLEAAYSEYESTPGYICEKITKETNNYSTTSEITVETLVGGKKKVRYITYIPSEKALSKKAEEEKMESFRLQKNAESSQSEEQE